MKKILQISSVFWLMFLVSCAQLGLAPPQTLNEKLAVAYGTITEITTAATLALNENKISVIDGQNIANTAELALQGLNVVKVMQSSDLPAAEAKLKAVQAGLDILRSYLIDRSKKHE